MMKGDLDTAVKTLALAKEVGGKEGQIEALLSYYQKWQKNWNEAVTIQLPEIEKDIEQGKIQSARNKLNQVRYSMIAQGGRQLPPINSHPKLLALDEALQKKENEIKKAELESVNPSFYQIDFNKKNNHGRPVKSYLVDKIPVCGYQGGTAPMTCLSKCKTPFSDGKCYPDIFSWEVSSIHANQVWLTSNLFWWGNHFSGETIARLTVFGEGRSQSFDIIVNSHTGEWNKNSVKPAAGVTMHNDVIGTGGVKTPIPTNSQISITYDSESKNTRDTSGISVTPDPLPTVGRWTINANSYTGILEISGGSADLSARIFYDVSGKWETMADVKYNSSTGELSFRRPWNGNPQFQKYSGTVDGDSISGSFIDNHSPNKSFSWKGKK